ncbi:MAG: HAD-IC family P-type ATPase, partial [Clostridia bacterium]|nr:HAD-IC family P-type ATPase [Clostridia bacterium]
ATSFEDLGTYAFGASEFVNCNLSDELKAKIFELSSQGKRVLLLVHSNEYLSEDEVLPQNTTPLALIAIEDHIREDAVETIDWFKENGVNVKIISGDNPITVSNIAKRVGVENAESCVSLEGLSLQEVEKIADKFTVFGRVSPEQKHTIIKTLKKQGNVVAMTGDGVNDTLALKEADCSIAMADGSEVARSLSNLVLMNSKFSSLPAVVREGRRVINNVQLSSTLFLMKTLFTILLSLFAIITSTEYPFGPAQLLPLEMFVIGLPSVLLALQPNTKLLEGNFIPVVLKKSIPSGLMMFFNVLACIVLVRFGAVNAEEYQTLATAVLLMTGYMNLVFLCLPPTKIRIFTLATSVTLIIISTFVLGDLFKMTMFNLKVGLLVLAFMAICIPLNLVIPKIIKAIENAYKKNKIKKSQQK